MKIQKKLLSLLILPTATLTLASCNKGKVLKSIEIATYPTKLIYNVGETLDTSGLSITLIFDDGSTEVTDSGISILPKQDYTFTEEDAEAGGKAFAVCYGPTLFTGFVVQVLNPSFSLEITSLPTKIDYLMGETFDPTGLVVTANYQSGKTSIIPYGGEDGYQILELLTGDYIFTEEDANNGVKLFTILYKDKTATFAVNVSDLAMQIEIITLPTDLEYGVDDKLDITGIQVQVTYKNIGSKIIPFGENGYTILELKDGEYIFTEDDAKNKQKTFTVSYQNQTTTFDVEVWYQAYDTKSLADVLNKIPSGGEGRILLNENEDGYCLKGLTGGTLGAGKTLTLKSVSNDHRVKYYVGDGIDRSGEGNGDWSFQGTYLTMTDIDVVFKGGTMAYQGFVNALGLTFNNCTFTGTGMYWGVNNASTDETIVTFNKCEFIQTTDSTETYNIWTHTGRKFYFNECTFISSARTINADCSLGVDHRYEIYFKKCNFLRTKDYEEPVDPSKPEGDWKRVLCPAVRIKDEIGKAPMDVYFEGKEDDYTFEHIDKMKQTNSKLYEAKLTTQGLDDKYYSNVYINGELVWAKGKKVN